MTRLPVLVPLVLLAACEAPLSDWSGPGAFDVHAAFLTTCTDQGGATHALGVATSGRNCDGYEPVLDEPPGDPCDAWRELVADACDPTATLASSATDVLSFWLADLDADAGLVGASTAAADHFTCKDEKGGAWTGDTEALSGTVAVDDVQGDVATVGVALGKLKGDVAFTVCR
jgi:hypothetical protein